MAVHVLSANKCFGDFVQFALSSIVLKRVYGGSQSVQSGGVSSAPDGFSQRAIGLYGITIPGFQQPPETRDHRQSFARMAHLIALTARLNRS
jgi:hypothetical protein